MKIKCIIIIIMFSKILRFSLMIANSDKSPALNFIKTIELYKIYFNDQNKGNSAGTAIGIKFRL
jgi:hypothetical protein